MLSVHAATIRLFLHVLAATVWVGGQVALAGLVPVVRRVGGVETARAVARRFQLIAWPAFGVLVALATWRSLAGPRPSRRAMGAYLGCAVLAAGLVSAAGYWGGELLVAG